MRQLIALLLAAICSPALLAQHDDVSIRGQRFERAVAAAQRVMKAWIAEADSRTLLLPDRLTGVGSGLAPGDTSRIYTPHNSGADLYPYLILTAELTDPELYRGRMMDMLRNEIRYTNTAWNIPANLNLKTGELGEPSMFGAGEYAKDGLLTVTEYLGRTPWYYRMVDMVAAAMDHASVSSRFGNLPKYRKHVWEPRGALPLGSFDGYADTIESAIYLVAREPVPEALAWIESEMDIMLGMQKADGHIEYWYGEGNFNRTALLYALMQSRGVRPVHWQPGMRVGATQDGQRLHLSLVVAKPTVIRFDYARHTRILNLDRNYVRLNEFPEWFTVDNNTLYRVSRVGAASSESIRLGAELIQGVTLDAGQWTIEPAAK